MASFTVPKGVAVPVTAKGTKGFLAWLALNQGPIYDKIAPQLKQMAAAEAQSAPVKPALSGLGQFDDSSGDISVDNSGDATDFSSTLDSSVPPAPTCLTLVVICMSSACHWSPDFNSSRRPAPSA